MSETGAADILKALLNEGIKIANFIDQHPCHHTLNAGETRMQYGTCILSVSLDLWGAIHLLIHKTNRAPALMLMRPLIESSIKGTWILAGASDEEVERVTTDKRFWKKKRLRQLIADIETVNDALGDKIVVVFRSTYPYLNDFIHISNTLLNRYLNKVTKTIEQNVPDEEVVPMLDLANQLALISKLNMELSHTFDPGACQPFIDKFEQYQRRSSELMSRLHV